MSMNLVQFQPSLSLPEFLRTYDTEATCEQALAHARWPGGLVCPRYGSANAQPLPTLRLAVLAVPRLPGANPPARRHRVRRQQAAADHLVPGRVPAEPQQKRLGHRCGGAFRAGRSSSRYPPTPGPSLANFGDGAV